MRYLSLFSGIEAASVAWRPLGWSPVAFSEISPFACSLLDHYYPSVPNLGDVTAITRDVVTSLGLIDLVVFGFPCQDLSVAGQRKGLHDGEGSATRSGLFFDAMRVVEWSGARWALAENVPGLLSSNRGRDFASVVGTMAGADVDVPENGWRSSGVVAGPRGLVEWVILDAQFFGVPQRRRRVFIVRDSGNWRGRPPLFLDAHSLSGHPPPRREAGQGVAGSVAAYLGGRGLHQVIPIAAANMIERGQNGDGIGQDGDPMFTLDTKQKHGIAFSPQAADKQTNLGFDADSGTSPSLCVSQNVAVAFKASHYTRGKDGAPSDVATSLSHDADKGDQDTLIAFDTTQVTSKANRSHPQPGDACHPLTSAGHPPALAFQTRCSRNGRGTSAECGSHADTKPHIFSSWGVRRLTPRECERLMGFPDDYTLVPYRGKPAKDGPRYAAIGNSMAVNCMRWIGQRIAMVDALSTEQGP